MTTAAAELGVPLMARPDKGLAFDRRWTAVTLLVGMLYLLGVLYAWFFAPPGLSFSARVATVFAPLAGLVILLVGWTPGGFPIAAGVYFSFLPLAQAANETHLLFVERGEYFLGVPLEVALALPVVLTGLMSGSRPPTLRRLPLGLTLGWALILLTALLSSLLAEDRDLAFCDYLARFLAPVLVVLAAFRRLRDLTDYRMLWLGYVGGVAIVAVFNIQRIVFNVLPWYATIDQRSLGASLSYSIPIFYAVGPALWLGHALAIRRTPLHGLPWLLFAFALMGLVFLGGHRGPTVFFGLLVLWWLPGHLGRHALNPRNALMVVLAGAALIGMITYARGRTTADVGLTVTRLGEMREHGLRQESRWFLWTEGLEYWKQSPLWGIGPNNWQVRNPAFESCHSGAVGALVDVGLLGTAAMLFTLVAALQVTSRARLPDLGHIDREYVAGCRASWIVMMGLLAVDLPFTSGQLKNSIFTYIVYLYPLLAMMLQARYPGRARADLAGVPAPARP